MFIDSNLLVNAVLDSGRKGVEANKFISQIEKGIVSALTNTIVIDESVWTIQKYRGKEKAIKYFEKFLELPNLIILDTNKEILLLAPQLMREHDLDPTDAIHVATMKYHNINEIISEDKHFDKVSFITRKTI